MTKGQLGRQFEKSFEANIKNEYPTEILGGMDDVTNYDRWRAVHRRLANQQMKEVISKARRRRMNLEKGLFGYILDVKNVHKVITTGMEESTVTLLLIGNGEGAAGFGFGKGEDSEASLIRAKINAERDMIAIDRYEGRTIYHPLHGKHNGTRVMMRPTRRGTGVHTGDLLYLVCECFGVEDVVGKMMGGRNPYSQIQAIFSAFQKHSSYEENAWGRGRRVRDLGFYGFKNYEDKDYGGMMRNRDKI
jgi:ribosomal protein S5